MQKDYQKFYEVAETAALKGGAVLKKWWGNLVNVREKSSSGDLVTEADHDSEAVVLSEIRNAFPHHRIVSEESGLSGHDQGDFLWAVDPLDGTTNYTHKMPLVAVSIALLFKGQPVVGVVYNPFMGEMFKAIQGEGAYLNGSRIGVSKVATLDKSLLATGFAYDRRDTPDNNYLEFCYMTSITQGVRRMGSAALDLAFLASGRYDGFWERGLKIWDIAAGILLVKEAGGMVTSYENSDLEMESGRILASNGLVHEQMSRNLIAIRKKNTPFVF